jgi:hypothetical protein
MLRVLFYAIPLVLAIFAVVDCLQTPDEELRGLPRFGWLALILFFPIVGSAVWLIVGRRRGGAPRSRMAWPAGPGLGRPDQQRPTRRFSAPDDDPEFLSQLGRSTAAEGNSEHDALLEQWERDLHRREADLRGDAAEPAPGEGPPDEDGPEPDTAGTPRG